MRDGYKVFDADAHVLYPKDLWPRYLDERFRHRIGRKQPIDGWETYNPTTVDGRWTQHHTVLYGQFQKLIAWTSEVALLDHAGSTVAIHAGDNSFGCSSLGVTSGGDRDDVVVVAGLVYALAFLGQVERPESWPIPVFANGS